jgi:hypothetical protein
MTDGLNRTMAKIYQFPDLRRERMEKEAAALKPAAGIVVVSGGSWYHEEAVRDAVEPAVTR